LRSIVGGSAAVATPFLAGLLLPFIGLSGVMIFDLATFGLAVITLLLAVVPPLPQATTAVSIETGFWLELRQGFTYIWQERVPAALQGRVFAVHQMARQAMTPLGILLGGLLADHWFEPAMQANGAFSALFAPLVGSGPGSGIAVMFLGTAVLGIVVGFIGYRIPAVYRIEEGTRAIL
jgi:hypothetical protein